MEDRVFYLSEEQKAFERYIVGGEPAPDSGGASVAVGQWFCGALQSASLGTGSSAMDIWHHQCRQGSTCIVGERW